MTVQVVLGHCCSKISKTRLYDCAGCSRALLFTNVRVFFCFCVEVLRPSQPNGVMSSAVSLPNHTFTGQA